MFIKNQIRSSGFALTEMRHSHACWFLNLRVFNHIFHCNTAHANLVEHDDTNDKLQKCNCIEVSKTGL